MSLPLSQLRPAFVTFGALALITGLAYPLGMTAASRVLMPSQSSGSLIREDGQVIGSRLIGQSVSDPSLFWGRLSATGDQPYNASNSGGSNLSAGNPDLRKAAQTRITLLQSMDPGNAAPIPLDLVTSSASGLDPHISPAGADYQVPRVARLRNLEPQVVRDLVRRHTRGRTFGFLGEPCVNVLELNLELDRIKAR
jgi:potassium-transporting ATPase KdpC subunit